MSGYMGGKPQTVVSVDINGNQVSPGVATIADGANVTQGTTTDAAYTSGAGTIVSILKGVFAKIEAVRAILAGTITTLESSKAVAAGDTATATNGAATLTLADPGASLSNVIGGVWWSYSAAPTGGRLTITDNGTLVFDEDITAAGPGFFTFPRPKKFTIHTATVITLAAGGSGVVGKINKTSWTE